MNINKTFVAGRLTRDPEIKMTPQGTAIAGFSVAVNRKWRDADKQEREEVTFLDCEAWGKTADTIAKHFAKGKEIYVEGRLKSESWEDKTSGQKRSKLKIVVESFQFVGGPTERGAAPAQTEQRETFFAPDAKPSKPAFEDDSQIPF